MGEYLSKPDRNKQTESGESDKVTYLSNFSRPTKGFPAQLLTHPCFRSATLQLACRDGADPWRTRTLLTPPLETESLSSQSLMAMVVS